MKFSKIKLVAVKEKDYDYNSRKIKNTLDVVQYVNEIEDLKDSVDERVLVICLNTVNQIISYSQIAQGGTNFANFETSMLFKTVLLSAANKFILVHNHPSGNIKPSKYDFEMTERIKKGSELLGLKFLDHIIVCGEDYISIFNELY